jgi:dihydroflavonol-4-reductase
MTDRAIAAVTGASGFVGSAVVRQLLDAGYAVRAIVRPTSPRANLTGLAVTTREADMRDFAAMTEVLKGADVLFHVAADYRLWARDANEIVTNNLSGTDATMRAALAARVSRVVYTSSVATLAVNATTLAATEDGPLDAAQAIGAYKRSKVVAERRVEELVRDQGLNAVIVNPSTPIGPRDLRPTPTGRVIVQAARGKIPAFVDTGLNLVGVDDVARGHILALNRGRIGERYILGGENRTLKELLEAVARRVGRPAPKLRLPRAPLYPIALIAESIAHLTGREPLITRDALKMSANRMFFSSEKAERELGYAPLPYAFALEAALDWFDHAGFLK